MANCICGCGKELTEGRKKWADGWECRTRYFVKRIKSGCLPIGEIEIKECPVCREEFISWNQSPRKTCQGFRQSNCNQILQSHKMKGNDFGKSNTIEAVSQKSEKERPKDIIERIQNYCIQDSGVECKIYRRCMGRREFTGKCFQES